jgi:16S rRNA (uracil1498-N3)-methyltransferase
MEWVVQKATELGLHAVLPFPAERSDARPPSAARLERWRRIAIEACKQCGRSRVPEIELRDDLAQPSEDRSAILLDGGERVLELGELLSGPPAGEVWLAVGPESGFTPQEIARWTEKGWQSGRLGPRTLRTETAGLVAASVVMHRWGDLGSARGPESSAGRES